MFHLCLDFIEFIEIGLCGLTFSLDQIKSLTITTVGCSQDVDSGAVLLDIGFPVRLAGALKFSQFGHLRLCCFS